MTNPYEPVPVSIINITPQTGDTKLFKIDMKTYHLPGQFLEVSLPGIGEAPISIASHSERFIELIIRNVGSVTGAISSLIIGDTLWVRGPYGNGYPLKKLKGKDIVIVAGGTGLAPPRGLVKYIESHREDFGRVNLFLGFNEPKNILVRDDIARWEKTFNLELTVDTCSSDWCGNVGLVTGLLEKSTIEGKDWIAVACGPPVMIRFVTERLLTMGFSEEAIFVSLERLMMCGIGKCGHCMVGDKYVCKDGPVFDYKTAKGMVD